MAYLQSHVLNNKSSQYAHKPSWLEAISLTASKLLLGVPPPPPEPFDKFSVAYLMHILRPYDTVLDLRT